MTDEPVIDPERSRIMRAVGRSRTKPEMVVRRALHAAGYRFVTNYKGLPGSPDIVFTKRRKVIFVHGCFWHRHPGCRLASTPKTRTEFWTAKFDANVERDQAAEAALEAAGWKVFTIWECETRSFESVFDSLTKFLGSPRYA
ncbi:very short patch repair endonuclease [Qipengyuania spongiae]|uniref:Very short patch repair endonuclease n=1 Tax=Qipengyuania spongiae TaxID=2909673 RepID=A0ABY5T383_9SPHN|nr:very short patch repair endonuclease [Qipengyuania spongiae]UVI40014.1 very short patch repair endonuclease [Qipengyuania spongiae]